MRWDVICVGGGPSGTLTAGLLANRGFNVLVVEDDPIIGRPVRCAGLITKRVLNMAGIGEEVVRNKITGARIHAPNETTMFIGGNKTHALVIDREAFDRKLAEKILKEINQEIFWNKITELKSQIKEIERGA